MDKIYEIYHCAPEFFDVIVKNEQKKQLLSCMLQEISGPIMNYFVENKCKSIDLIRELVILLRRKNSIDFKYIQEVFNNKQEIVSVTTLCLYTFILQWNSYEGIHFEADPVNIHKKLLHITPSNTASLFLIFQELLKIHERDISFYYESLMNL